MLSLIVAYIFAGVCGGIAAFFIIKVISKLKQKKQEKNIIQDIKKQPYDFIVKGKKIDLLNEKSIDKFEEENQNKEKNIKSTKFKGLKLK